MKRSVFHAAIIFAMMFMFFCCAECFAQPVSIETAEESDIAVYHMAKANRRPIFIEFYSSDCAYCSQMAPIVEKLKTQWGSKVVFTKFDVKAPQYRNFVSRFNIESVPAFQFIDKYGKMRDMIIGAVPEQEIEGGLKLITEGGTGTHIGQPPSNTCFTKLGAEEEAAPSGDLSVFEINARKDGLEKYNLALKCGKPMIVDFSTNWCGWYQKLAPELKSLEVKWGKKVVFVNLDAEHPRVRNLKQKYKVAGYPTIVFIRSDGKEERNVSGYIPSKEIEPVLQRISR